MSVFYNDKDVEKRAKEIIYKSEYDYVCLGDKKYRECHTAIVQDKDGYCYKFKLKEIEQNKKKSPFRNNPLIEYNYINYVNKTYEDIIIDKFNYVNRDSLMFFRCKKHLNKGEQSVKAKYIRNKKCLCNYCIREYVGKCNSLCKPIEKRSFPEENGLEQIAEFMTKNNCDYIDSKIIQKNHRNVRVVYFKCNKHNAVIQERNWSAIKKSNTPCLKCNKEILYNNTVGNIEDIIKSPLFQVEKIEILGYYTNVSTKILCQCNYCNHQWYVTPNKLKQGRGCPLCAQKLKKVLQMKTQEQAQNDINSRYKNIRLIGTYNGDKSKAEFICIECGITWQSPYGNVLRGTAGCPQCRSSVGEYNISKYLTDNKVLFNRQFSFNDCKYIEPLKYDFYLPEYNTVIEFQGEQHYFPVNFSGHWNEIELCEQFKYTQIRDKIKRDYCKCNGIQMVEIPYWDKNNVKEYLANIF